MSRHRPEDSASDPELVHLGTPEDSKHGAGVEIGSLARVIVLVTIIASMAAAVAGAIVLWPETGPEFGSNGPPQLLGASAEFAAAEVIDTTRVCGPDEQPGSGADPCGQATATLTEGPDTGTDVDFVAPEVTTAGLTAGDGVRLVRLEKSEATEGTTYVFDQVQRGRTLLWLLSSFVIAVVVVARWRGLMGLIGLSFGAIVVWQFTLPALLAGESGLGVAMTSATAIMVVVLYTTHGFSMRSSVALLGTLAGVLLTGCLGVVSMNSARLSGISDETAGVLGGYVQGLDFRGLLICGIVLAGLGVLNDVTITQASAVWELRAAAPTMTRRTMFSSAMRIGRDHIASSIYTLLFAYAGTALLVLLLLSLQDRSAIDTASSATLAEEIVRTLTSGIGLVLAVPITTALACVLAAPAQAPVETAELL